MRCLLDQNNISVEELAKKVGMRPATIDNVMIDAVMFGIAQKKDGVIVLLPSSEEELFAMLQSFFKKHIV